MQRISFFLLTVLQLPYEMVTLLNYNIPRHTDKVLGLEGTHRLNSKDKMILHLLQGHTLLQVLIPVDISAATIYSRIHYNSLIIRPLELYNTRREAVLKPGSCFPLNRLSKANGGE